MKILRFVLPLIPLGLIMSPVCAADEAAIQDLQSDVTVTKSKADKNAQDINNLKGGLPAVEARVIALEAALTAADGTIGQLQAQVAALTVALADYVTATQLASKLDDYATNQQLATLQTDVTALGSAYMAGDSNLQLQIDGLSAVDVTVLENRVADVEETLLCVTYDVAKNDLIFVGCNVHVRDGSGSTQSTTGLGNLIIGYNADSTTLFNRTGSHNLIIGDDQAYPGIGQLLTKDIVSSGDLSVLVGRDLEETVNGSRRTILGLDSFIEVGRDIQASVGSNLLLGIAGNLGVNANDVGITSSNLLNVESGLAMISSDGNMKIEGSANVTVQAAGTLALKGAAITEN